MIFGKDMPNRSQFVLHGLDHACPPLPAAVVDRRNGCAFQ
jgi:hypothetical protein